MFLTSSADFYAEGFEVAACHYLIKPITPQKLEEAMRRLCKLLIDRKDMLTVPIDRGEESIPQRSIRYVETVCNGVCIHCVDGDQTVRYPLSSVMAQLNPGQFVQCHRFFIVNLDFVADEDDESFVLRDGTRLLIRREGRREIKEAYHRFFLARMRGDM